MQSDRVVVVRRLPTATRAAVGRNLDRSDEVACGLLVSLFARCETDHHVLDGRAAREGATEPVDFAMIH
jgi:hypothetical protein